MNEVELTAQAAKKIAEIKTIMKRRTLILDSLNLITIYTSQDITWTLEHAKLNFLH